MTRLVLESFYYARDGRNAKLLRAGKTVRVPEDILPEHVERFVAEGKIASTIDFSHPVMGVESVFVDDMPAEVVSTDLDAGRVSIRKRKARK